MERINLKINISNFKKLLLNSITFNCIAGTNPSRRMPNIYNHAICNNDRQTPENKIKEGKEMQNKGIIKNIIDKIIL